MHFAAHTVVPDSVHDSLKYCGNNTCAARELLCQVSGRLLCVYKEARRPDGPRCVVAVANRIRYILGWMPNLDDLETIIATAYDREWKRVGR